MLYLIQRGRTFLKCFKSGLRVPQRRYDIEYGLRFFYSYKRRKNGDGAEDHFTCASRSASKNGARPVKP